MMDVDGGGWVDRARLARNWIFGLLVVAVLLMLFAKTPDADAWLYELTNTTRDRGEMLSNKRWDDLHNTPEYQGRTIGRGW